LQPSRSVPHVTQGGSRVRGRLEATGPYTAVDAPEHVEVAGVGVSPVCVPVAMVSTFGKPAVPFVMLSLAAFVETVGHRRVALNRA